MKKSSIKAEKKKNETRKKTGPKTSVAIGDLEQRLNCLIADFNGSFQCLSGKINALEAFTSIDPESVMEQKCLAAVKNNLTIAIAAANSQDAFESLVKIAKMGGFTAELMDEANKVEKLEPILEHLGRLLSLKEKD